MTPVKPPGAVRSLPPPCVSAVHEPRVFLPTKASSALLQLLTLRLKDAVNGTLYFKHYPNFQETMKPPQAFSKVSVHRNLCCP